MVFKFKTPLEHTNFNLDVSGIAGFFGGEESFAAMSSMHLMRHRRWLGWYNSPGSYFIAKKYGTLAKSRLWNGLFPGPPVEPAEMLELDSKDGPRYMGVHSGTRLDKTGHIAYLIARYCEQIDLKFGDSSSNRVPPPPPTPDSEAESSSSSKRSPATSHSTAKHEKKKNFSVTIVDLGTFEKWAQYPNIPEGSLLPFEPYGILVSLATIVGGVLSALWGDWYSFAMIFLGAISSGLSSYVLGSGILTLRFPDPSPNSPPGDGILVSARDIIVLKGNENSVSNIIRGRYHLAYASHPKYRDIGLSSVLLILQFLLQLFLVPQGQLIGQIMFLGTFVFSWGFNAYLASVDRETLQTDVLFKTLGMGPRPKFEKLHFEKWSMASAFVAFYLHPDTLKDLLPNETAAWSVWKSFVSEAFKEGEDPTGLPESQGGREKMAKLNSGEQKFVGEFIKLASEAHQKAKAQKIDDARKKAEAEKKKAEDEKNAEAEDSEKAQPQLAFTRSATPSESGVAASSPLMGSLLPLFYRRKKT